jgi:formiminotetrahydrofolate cyclodeaminase
MNVRINLAGLKDEEAKATLRKRVQEIRAESESRFKAAHDIVEKKLG